MPLTQPDRMVYKNELDDFIATLDNAASSTAEDVTTKVIHMMGEEIAMLARRYAPKVTGELKDSIKVDYGHRSAEVRATAPYAVFVEFGTWQHNIFNPRMGTYTIEPKRPGGVLRFTGSDGSTVFTRKVEHPGIKAQLFMSRANEEVIQDFTGKLANVGVYLVTG